MPAIAIVPMRNNMCVQGIFDFKPAHLADILFTGERMDDRAGRQKEQGLEKSVGHEMEDRGGIGAESRIRETCSRIG